MKKILIAEDDADLTTLYRTVLSGYDIIEARNGREAVELHHAHNPDLTIMDIRMPVMNGDEAIREIMSSSPSASIIAVTAFSHTSEELGVPVLRKGFSLPEFVENIRTALAE